MSHATPKKTIRIAHDDNFSFAKLCDTLSASIPKDLEELVILCIGTDRSSGDSFGPLVGRALSKESIQHVHVYGNLEHPVHAINLEETISTIERNHPQAFVIAIDAALGRLASVGHICLSNGPLKPGAGVSKNLPSVGDLSIKGVVNVGGFMELFVLQNTRLFTVIEMAELTARSLIWVLRRHSFRKSPVRTIY